MEKKFTEEDVEHLIKTTMHSTLYGFREWLIKETVIQDKTTKEPIENSEIGMGREKMKSLMDDYVYPRLEQNGIKITPNEEN